MARLVGTSFPETYPATPAVYDAHAPGHSSCGPAEAKINCRPCEAGGAMGRTWANFSGPGGPWVPLQASVSPCALPGRWACGPLVTLPSSLCCQMGAVIRRGLGSPCRSGMTLSTMTLRLSSSIGTCWAWRPRCGEEAQAGTVRPAQENCAALGTCQARDWSWDSG
jgi:hypothetical protein